VADVLRAMWHLVASIAAALAPWVFGVIVGAVYSLAGLVVVFTVAGADGPRAAIVLALCLLGLFLAAVVAWGVWHCHRINRRVVAPTQLVVALRSLHDVRVSTDHEFGTGAVCQHCGCRPAVVRVYGKPASRHMFPLELAEVCAADALAAARQAISEQDEFSRSPIRIEVAA
jgi:hypothetical protein